MFYTIGAFSEKTNLTAHTLRYYEKEQLLAPNRSDNGRRYYTEQDVNWIVFIKRLKETGMPIKQIKKYAQLRAMGDITLQERMLLLQNHRRFVLEKMAQWQENLDKLEHKIDYYQAKISVQVEL